MWACYGRAPYAMTYAAPEISVVIPCLNEEEAVGKVVDQALEGIRRSGRSGEVIVVDNASTDRSADIAAEHGAVVVREERPGYGSAYLAGLAHARGEYIVMGDADETYPMQELAPFVERLAAGDDLVMGSRFEGTIHGEAMPWLNRHIGNPILTGLLNVLFGVKISDANSIPVEWRSSTGSASRRTARIPQWASEIFTPKRTLRSPVRIGLPMWRLSHGIASPWIVPSKREPITRSSPAASRSTNGASSCIGYVSSASPITMYSPRACAKPAR